MLNFVLLSHPRCATSYLSNTVLRSHPSVRCLDELFANTKRTTRFLEQANIEFPSQRIIENQEASIQYLNSCAAAAREISKRNFVGFKLFPGRIPDETVKRLMQETRVLCLKRELIEHSALSHQIAKNTGQWSARQRSSFEPFSIDMNELFRFIKLYSGKLEQYINYVPEPEINLLTLEYEDLFEDSTLQKIWGFLDVGLPGKDVQIQKNELNSVERYKRISNIEDVRKELLREGFSDIFAR